MESHPERVSALPYELLEALIQSLLVGSTHHDQKLAKGCLEGIEGLVKAHLKSQVLAAHLVQSAASGPFRQMHKAHFTRHCFPTNNDRSSRFNFQYNFGFGDL